MNTLSQKHCAACEGEADRLNSAQARQLQTELHPKWFLDVQQQTISRNCKFVDFGAAVRFINQVAELAESEGHHPDINLHNYRYVRITLSTHAVKGLSENDFILASKIDTLLPE